MKKILFLLILFSMALAIEAQDKPAEPVTFSRYNIGFGGGIDYGGFGGRFTMLTSERFEVFGAVGYNLLGAGVNAGADFRISPGKRICPYVGGMYGYNGVIKVTGAEMYNQTYYGLSLNFGLEFWSSRNPNYFNIELIVPFRSAEYSDDYKSLKNNPNIVFTSESIPVAISLGYHFGF